MKWKYIAIIIAVALVLSLATAFFYEKTVIIKVQAIDTDIKVADHGGFNLDRDAMHFGLSTPGGSVERSIVFSNEFPFPVRVVIQTEGNISKWLYVSNPDFKIMPNSTETVKFSVYVPSDAAYGIYTGKIRAIYRRI